MLVPALLGMAGRTAAQDWTLKHNNTAEYYRNLHFPSQNTGYAVSNSLIAKTTDNGETWTDMPVALPVPGGFLMDVYFTSDNVGCVVSAANTSTGGFSPGDGFILRTTNGGTTWTTVLPPDPEVPLYAIHFSGSDTGYAAGGEASQGKIYRTTNGGVSWQAMYASAPGFTKFMTDVYAVSPTKVIAAGRDELINFMHEIWQTNNATTFTENYLLPTAAPMTIFNISFADANHGFMLGKATNYKLIKTMDGGSNWSLLNTIPAAFDGVYSCGFSFPTADTGFIAGNMFYTTTDGGNTWTAQSAPANTATMKGLYFLNGSLGFACGGGQILKYVRDPLPMEPLAIRIEVSDTVICAGEQVQLNAVVQNSFGPVQYQWWPTQGLSCSNCADPIASPAMSTTYTVTATDLLGTAGATVNITVNSLPVADITNPDVIYLDRGSSVVLHATGGDNYTWLPETWLMPPAGSDVTASPKENITYTVTVRSAEGCSAMASVRIELNKEELMIPNAFSPNGDGLNDRFKMMTNNGDLHLQTFIFNRWGQEVYHSNNDVQGWDGSRKGAPVEAGVYFYQIEVFRTDGSSEAFKGDLTLVR